MKLFHEQPKISDLAMLDLETDCIEIPSEKADEDVQGISSGIIDPEN